MSEQVQVRPALPRKRKVWKILLSALIIVILVVVGIGYAVLRQGLPQTAGKLTLPGLTAPVIVTRDEEGVPHIEAESLQDLYMAQGYVQAQDRLFQMDLSRRQASGRLAEVFGEAAVEQDKMFRVLGLRRAGEASLAAYNQEARDVLAWFCQGVNAYLAQGNLPVEFTLAGYRPEPWTVTDTLTIAKFMAHDLGGHWESQAFRQYLLEHFTQAEAYELFPSYPQEAPTIIGRDISVLPGLAQHSTDQVTEWNGSNNWVVSGEKSASGLPILADDPHLSVATPSVWYQMHLKAQDVDVSGVIFGGVPGIILGHNQHVAWGVTNTSPDVQDLYIEQPNPENPYEFRYMDQWEKATVYQEDILVKGGKVIPFEVVVTRHGPIVSDLSATGSGDDPVYALRWTAHMPTPELEAVLGMNRAKNWAEFEKALERFQVPTQNFVFAAQDGTIAYKANGLIPIRKGDGLLPVPGWTDAYEWSGFIPFDELPKVVNPTAGYVSTANNKVVGDDYPYHISHIWSQPYRQMRIHQLLEAKDKLSVQDMQALQADVVDLHAQEFIPLFVQALAEEPLTGRQQAALDSLAAWNCETTVDAAGPLVFNLWYDQIVQGLFGEQLNAQVMGLFEGKHQTADALLRRAAKAGQGIWVEKAGGLPSLLLNALDRALDTIETQQGKDMKAWSWGKFHQVGFVHPLSQVAVLAPFFNPEGRKPSPGSNVTVRAASFRMRDGLNNHGASWRFIKDMAQVGEAYQIVAPGQSGHWLSPTYHKQFDRWIAGEHYLTTTQGFTGQVLTLVP